MGVKYGLVRNSCMDPVVFILYVMIVFVDYKFFLFFENLSHYWERQVLAAWNLPLQGFFTFLFLNIYLDTGSPTFYVAINVSNM